MIIIIIITAAPKRAISTMLLTANKTRLTAPHTTLPVNIHFCTFMNNVPTIEARKTSG
jgi:hypothetical protein